MNCFSRTITAAVFCLGLFPGFAADAPAAPEPRRLVLPEETVVFHPVSKAPEIDGDLSDAAWQGIPARSDFKLTRLEGKKHDGGRIPPLRTEAKLGYDRHKMYFAFRCYDPEAKELPPGSKPDDSWKGDHVTMFFAPRRPDSDMQQATFYCNGGKHLSYRGMAPARPFQSTWGQLRSAVRFHDGYWDMEAEIPFANLEFNPEKDRTMRGQIAREMSRRKPPVCVMAGDAFFNMFEYNAFRPFEYSRFPLGMRFDGPAPELTTGTSQVKVLLRNNSAVTRPGRAALVIDGPKKRYYRSGLRNLKPGEEIPVTLTVELQDGDNGISLAAYSQEGFLHYDSGVLPFSHPAFPVRRAKLLEAFAKIDGGSSQQLDAWRRELADVSAAQTPEAWEKLDRRLGELEDSASDLAAGAALGGKELPGKPFFPVVFSSLDKVRDQRRLPHGRGASSAALAGAAGEVVNFQAAAVAAGDAPVEIVSVEPESPFPARVFRVEEVETGRNGFWPDKLSKRLALRLDPERRIGMWWISVAIPRDAKAGTYSGKVKLTTAAGHAESIPFEVKVRDFVLPERSSKLLSVIGIAPFQGEQELKVSREKSWALLSALAMEYGLLPEYGTDGVRSLAGRNGWGLPANHRNITERFDAIILPNLPWPHEIERYLKDPVPRDRGKSVDDYFAGIARDTLESVKTLDRGNFRGTRYLYFDEVDPGDAKTLAYLTDLKEKSGCKLIACFDKSFAGYDYVKFYAKPVDLLYFNSSFFIDPKWKAQLDELQAGGKKIGWYLNLQSGFPTLNRIPVEGVAHRLHYWQAWRYHVDSTLFWGLNWYSAQEASRRPPRMPNDGNGCLAYPEGKDVVPSVRLELLRESMQDYCYLELLEQLLKARPDAPQAAAGRELLKLNWLGKKLTDIPDSPAKLLEAREAIASCIESLQKNAK